MPRAVWLGVVTVAGVAAALAIWLPPPPMPAFVPAIVPGASTTGLPRALALVEPVAHAPWFGTWPALLAAAIAAAVAAALWAGTLALTAAPAVATVVVAAALLRPDLRALVTLGAEPAMALGLTWCAMAVTRYEGTAAPRRARLALLAAAAAALWPPLAIAGPAALTIAVGLNARSAAAVALGGVAGAVVGAMRWAARASAHSGEAIGMVGMLAVIAPAVPRDAATFVWAPLAEPVVPAALALVGLVMTWRRADRGRAIGVALLLPLAAWAAMPAWRAELTRAMLWAAWPLAGVGLAADREGWRSPLPVAGAVLLLAGGVVTAAATPTVERVAAEATERALAGLPVPLTVVGEDPRTDTALMAWGARRNLRLVRPVAASVAAARDDGRLVLVGLNGRWALELWGFTVGPPLARLPAVMLWPLDGRLRCLPVATPWRELPGLEFTGRLGVHVPAGEGRFEAIVVGPPPLQPRLVAADGQPLGGVSPTPMALTSLPPVLWPGDGRLPDVTLTALRVALPAHADGSVAAALSLGQRAPLVAVRFTEPAHLTGVATVCAAPLPRDDPGEAGLDLTDDAYTAGGWHAAEPFGEALRWTSARAVLLVPSSAATAVTIRLTARAAAARAEVTLSVNGWPAGTQALARAARETTWTVPSGVWVAGTNEVAFDVSPVERPSDNGGVDRRLLGIAVSALHVDRR